MTSRDELKKLANWHGSESVGNRWPDARKFHRDAAATIRELLAQEPVGCVLPDGVGVYLDKPLQPDADLYAAPVPAVDIEAFKQEAMLLARELGGAHAKWAGNADVGVGIIEQKAAALQAHLDKLGGK